MTRLGWAILALVLLVGGAFVATTRFGGGDAGLQALRVDRRAANADADAMPAGVLTVPVAGVARAALRDSWGDARDGGARGHHGTDIPAAAGTPVRAAAPGRIAKLFQSVRGGTTAYVRSADGRWIYYYAHLAGYAPGLREGQAVQAGETIGFVGDTGDAGPGNYHLHFGIQRMAPGERWWQGQDINPYPMLARSGAGG